MNTQTKRVMSKCSSLKNAKNQLKLLHAIQYNKDFVPNPSLKQTRRRRR
jgi:NADH:ubiquinone oxidoreductase subunit E